MNLPLNWLDRSTDQGLMVGFSCVIARANTGSRENRERREMGVLLVLFLPSDSI